MPRFYINKMNELGLTKEGGFMLDLGCGKGHDSDYFKEHGFTVTSVDIASGYSGTIKSDIRNFKIEPGKYDVIICFNVLPFLEDKKVVEKIISDIIAGLTPTGCAFFSLFGPEDDWHDRSHMSFFSTSESLEILKRLDVVIVEKSSTQGYGTTIKGDTKFWDIQRYLVSKDEIWKR